jgi:hypothetical protein
MSMIGCFYALKDEDLEAIIKEPRRLPSLWGMPEPTTSPSFLSRLFGAKPQPAQQEEWQPSEPPTAFDVDKAWQGIHFLLTGSDCEGDGPLAFIMHGGREVENQEIPAHGFTSTEVKQIDAALRDIDPTALFQRADFAEFTKLQIYPDIWKSWPKEQSIAYVTDNFRGLKNFISDTAQSGRALIAYIG